MTGDGQRQAWRGLPKWQQGQGCVHLFSLTLRGRISRPDYLENPRTAGEHLLKRRHDLGLTQVQVAEALGVTVSTITTWEKTARSQAASALSAQHHLLDEGTGDRARRPDLGGHQKDAPEIDSRNERRIEFSICACLESRRYSAPRARRPRRPGVQDQGHQRMNRMIGIHRRGAR